ncbi:hypothetical protein ACFL6C_05100 [Myxococcota bacterium]
MDNIKYFQGVPGDPINRGGSQDSGDEFFPGEPGEAINQGIKDPRGKVYATLEAALAAGKTKLVTLANGRTFEVPNTITTKSPDGYWNGDLYQKVAQRPGSSLSPKLLATSEIGAGQGALAGVLDGTITVECPAGCRVDAAVQRHGNDLTVVLTAVSDPSAKHARIEEIQLPFPRVEDGKYWVHYADDRGLAVAASRAVDVLNSI